MSLVGGRAAFKAALSTVDDVTGYEYRPATPKAGDAWPLWSGGERADGRSFTNGWRVLVFLPQDERGASVWIDAHAGALVDAIEENVGFVDRLDPVELAAGTGGQYALQITVRGE